MRVNELSRNAVSSVIRWAHFFWFSVVAMIVLSVGGFLYVLHGHTNRTDLEEIVVKCLMIFGFAIVELCLLCLYLLTKIQRAERSHAWLRNVTQTHVAKLEQHVDKLSSYLGSQDVEMEKLRIHAEGKRKWPWGDHHTEDLGHLEAAAVKWWKLYDPGDPSTAPINDDVADWLQTERNVSKDKARVMASILRADGLPVGRRRW